MSDAHITTSGDPQASQPEPLPARRDVDGHDPQDGDSHQDHVHFADPPHAAPFPSSRSADSEGVPLSRT